MLCALLRQLNGNYFQGRYRLSPFLDLSFGMAFHFIDEISCQRSVHITRNLRVVVPSDITEAQNSFIFLDVLSLG